MKENKTLLAPINSAKQKQNTNPKKNLDLITLRSDYQEGPRMKQFQTKVFDMNTEGEVNFNLNKNKEKNRKDTQI